MVSSLASRRDDLPLAGRVALVTGGSRGIGAGIVRRLAEDGADVAFTFRQSAAAAAAIAAEVERAGGQALPIVGDGAHDQAVARAVDHAAEALGSVDILVNSAGIFPYGPIEAVTTEELDLTLALHVREAFLGIQAALAHMTRGGRIITVGSTISVRVPVAGVALYAMTKAALLGLTRGLARDVGPRGITANIVNPGPVDTDMNPPDGDLADEERALTALGRYGEARDIAAMVAFLASDAGATITGASIAVDGGYLA